MELSDHMFWAFLQLFLAIWTVAIAYDLWNFFQTWPVRITTGLCAGNASAWLIYCLIQNISAEINARIITMAVLP